jgi:hypothetical protein
MDNTDTTTSEPVAEAPVTEQVEESTEGEDQVEETPQSETPAPEKEIDPLTALETVQLDPKVKEVLKAGFLRQADYTKKTQDIAEVRKAAEAYKQWQPIIGYLEKNPSIAESLFGVENKTKNNPTEPEIPDDPREFLKLAKEEAKKEAIAEFRKEMAVNRDIDDATALDPRLASDDSFSKQIAGMIEVNFGNEVRAGQLSIKEATAKALELHKQYEESLRQKVVADLNEKAKNKTMVVPSRTGSPLGTAPKGGKLTMQEAAKLAEEELSR